jgi:hypothetical protein
MFGALAVGGQPVPARQTPLPGWGLAEGSSAPATAMRASSSRRMGDGGITRIRDLAKDHVRDAEAARVGWETLRSVYEQVVEEPEEVCATVADVRTVRLGLFDPRLRSGVDHAGPSAVPPVGARQ